MRCSANSPILDAGDCRDGYRHDPATAAVAAQRRRLQLGLLGAARRRRPGTRRVDRRALPARRAAARPVQARTGAASAAFGRRLFPHDPRRRLHDAGDRAGCIFIDGNDHRKTRRPARAGLLFERYLRTARPRTAASGAWPDRVTWR